MSTFVRLLENKACLGHIKVGNSFQYYPLVTEEEKFSIEELKALIQKVENQK